MTLEYCLAIICLIFVIIARLIMWWCEKNTYMLGVGWAIKRKIYLWCQNKMKKSRLRG